MQFLSHTYIPVRWSSGPPCPPCSSNSPRSVTPLGTGGIFRFSCVVEITVSHYDNNNKHQLYLNLHWVIYLYTRCYSYSTVLVSKVKPQMNDLLCMNLAYSDKDHQHNKLIAQWCVINSLQVPNDKEEKKNKVFFIIWSCFLLDNISLSYKMADHFSKSTKITNGGKITNVLERIESRTLGRGIKAQSTTQLR